MAKKQLTIEEKLQAALVPVEEQPYKVPENWCWVKLSSVATVITGGTPSKKHPEYYGSDFPFFKPADLDSGRNIVEASEYLSVEGKSVARIIPAHSTAVCCIGTIGKCGYLEVDGATNQQINSMIPKIDPLYLYYYANTELFINQLWSKAVATTISIVNKSKMETNNVPLPPLAEQSSIVARIESFFAKLDEAKEKIQEVLDGADLRRAAILHQAFTGKLTEKWRRENGVADKWIETSSAKLFEYVTSGSRGWAQYYSNDGAIFLRMGNLNHGTIDLDLNDIQYVSLPDKTEGQRSRVKKGDILISITADVGMVACIKSDMEEAYINQHVALARPVEGVYPEFIAWYFVSDVGLKQLQNMQRGATKVGLTLKDIKSVKLKMPHVEEQQEIVRLLDNLLSREQSTVTACEEALTTIDTLKKSILARAFRGELGTNDPAEPNAKELLKDILSA